MLIFEWEGFGLKSFWKDTSLSLYIMRENERERLLFDDHWWDEPSMRAHETAPSSCALSALNGPVLWSGRGPLWRRSALVQCRSQQASAMLAFWWVCTELICKRGVSWPQEKVVTYYLNCNFVQLNFLSLNEDWIILLTGRGLFSINCRKELNSWTTLTTVPHDDGYQWRKYGKSRSRFQNFQGTSSSICNREEEKW